MKYIPIAFPKWVTVKKQAFKSFSCLYISHTVSHKISDKNNFSSRMTDVCNHLPGLFFFFKSNRLARRKSKRSGSQLYFYKEKMNKVKLLEPLFTLVQLETTVSGVRPVQPCGSHPSYGQDGLPRSCPAVCLFSKCIPQEAHSDCSGSSLCLAEYIYRIFALQVKEFFMVKVYFQSTNIYYMALHYSSERVKKM